jgi:hypothetical protein
MATPSFAPTGASNTLQPWTNPASSTGTSGGQNQYMSYPALPNFNPTNPSLGQQPGNYMGGKGGPGGLNDLGGNMFAAPTMDPQFTNQFYSYLTQLLGQSGGMNNNILSFLQGGPSSMPGASQLSNMAQTGAPVDQTAAWQAMIGAENQNTALGETALKEQMGSMGMLSSSSAADAMSQYLQQTTATQNAQLTAAQSQSLENAANRELTAGQGIQSEAGNMDQFLQSLLSQGALSSPNVINKNKTSGLGGILGGVGSLLGGAASLGTAASDAGGIGALFAGLI